MARRLATSSGASNLDKSSLENEVGPRPKI